MQEGVDEEAVRGVRAEAQQRHEGGVREACEVGQLRAPLVVALVPRLVQHLHGNFHQPAGCVPHEPAVHAAEAAGAQQALRGEAARGSEQLGEGEDVQEGGAGGVGGRGEGERGQGFRRWQRGGCEGGGGRVGREGSAGLCLAGL